MYICLLFFFFFNDTATTEIYTLSLHDALPICGAPRRESGRRVHAPGPAARRDRGATRGGGPAGRRATPGLPPRVAARIRGSHVPRGRGVVARPSGGRGRDRCCGLTW